MPLTRYTVGATTRTGSLVPEASEILWLTSHRHPSPGFAVSACPRACDSPAPSLKTILLPVGVTTEPASWAIRSRSPLLILHRPEPFQESPRQLLFRREMATPAPFLPI